MGLSMMFYYRRNLNGVPMSIQRAMHKQAMRDAYPHAYSDDELDAIVDKKIQNGEPYEEELLYLRNAHAIHEYLIKHLAGSVDNFDFGHYEIPIDLIRRLVIRGRYISKYRITPANYPYPKLLIEQWEKIVEVFSPIVENPELYPDPVIYEGTW
jgi:hypothetical protein